MLIGIDGNEANIRERVGVNVWAFEVLKHLKLQVTSYKLQVRVYLSRPPLPDFPSETENWKYRVIPPAKFWTRWRLPLDLYFHRPRPDVFLSLSHYAPKFAPMPRVVSIMDLSFLKYPEAFQPLVYRQLRDWTRESVKNATHIITISEFNKKEIERQYAYPEEKITVVYPGVSELFRTWKGPTLRDAGKYILFVGTLQPKKNLPRLIEAFRLVRKKFPDVALVVAGKTWGQFAGEKEEGKREKEEGITYLGYMSENDLPGLMAGAQCLVMPSLSEGFGIPAVEAMSVGTPVLASNVTSLPEIVGDAGLLFDPYDVKDMADKICQFLLMTGAEKQRLVKKGMIKAQRLDWSKAAKRILRILLKGVSLKEYP